MKVLFVAGVLAIAGCSKPIKAPPPGSTGSTVTSGPKTSGVADSGNIEQATGGASAADAAAQTASNIIYFDFDSSDIRPEFNPVLSALAKQLVANGTRKIRLEGHTDERGSPEYNIGLGERRAQAVRRALMLQGVSESQLSTVSYGEERPADPGQNEIAWAKNRRVEIVPAN
ncbi:MAG TPA: peptidoglycan-associated lipoprotein Pal [Steroidobacteraceae bacterium]|nr:peptidoglycan-associated lipoprotein Pal [Steroidobacteraceae bacterium]